MSTKMLDGRALRDMLIGGVECIRKNSKEINDLNVFPVPDGDTGTNMTMTMDGGVGATSKDENRICKVIEDFARGALLGARGNSGVILSQIFAGIRDGLAGAASVSAIELARAYEKGIEKSYSSVSNPTEGTILTVFRESATKAKESVGADSSIEDFYKIHIAEAQRSLQRTKEILPALTEADVVDSGGAGYLYIVEGMYEALIGELVPTYKSGATDKNGSDAIDFDRFTRDSVMRRGYCTEFLLRLCSHKVNPDEFDISSLRTILELLGGDSIVTYKEGDIVKVHVHTLDPGRVLTSAREFGEFLTVKIENMELGHSDTENVKKKEEPKKPKKPFSVLAVATGEGICSLFEDMGADGIIFGGQTSNPSTEEFVEAFQKHQAEDIIVLPNNKNVMLAAKQAAEIYTGARIHIIPTYTIMEGYGALSVITPGIKDIKTLVEAAERAAKAIVGSEVTRAVRSVTVNGVSIKEGDYISITDGKITSVADSRDEALLMMLRSLPDMDEYEIITLFVGESVDDEARVAITEALEKEYPECEVVVYKGKQAIYDYLIAIE